VNDNKEEKEKSKELDRDKEKENEKKGEHDKEKLRSLEGTNLDALLQRLPGCVSRDLIDQLTVRMSY
jgi:regulator of nonsense transcripts 2